MKLELSEEVIFANWMNRNTIYPSLIIIIINVRRKNL